MIARSWYGSAMFITRSGLYSWMSAVRRGTSIASICAVVIFVVTPFAANHGRFSISALIALQRASVRDAISSSPNVSGFWAIFAAATPATPPAPISITLLMERILSVAYCPCRPEFHAPPGAVQRREKYIKSTAGPLVLP